ncbi:hypothetical protein [Gemmobacter aquatilis]|uniref:hypothetical protein n=1 Tax=Gemmobacter aquatilis TaxID=933059 RepID=UPI000B8802B2|nr:hypothetical protein [Gemmobacter aquatilis]
MEYSHLTSLASLLGAHVDRSDMTVAKWCGVHARLFLRLKGGHGCRVDTYKNAMQAFSDRWPADLEWPATIPRPPKSNKEAA